jgi:7-cyano-7-deazaguanine synthase
VKAVVLLSGGLDSATALAVAKRDGREVYPLTIVYGQRHHAEVDAAMHVAESMDESTHVVNVPALGELAHSALTAVSLRLLTSTSAATDDGIRGAGDTSAYPRQQAIAVPKNRSAHEMVAGIPTTYVPARNTVLLGLALACAESIGAREIWTGFNVLDASGYPDCRPEFVRAFEALAQVATVPGLPWHVRTPLIELSKAGIISLGQSLGVDYALTHSCYDPVAVDPVLAPSTYRDHHWEACGHCDACQLRRKGFVEACIADPTRYA